MKKKKITQSIQIITTQTEESTLINSSPLAFKDFAGSPINEYFKSYYKEKEGLYDPNAFQQSDTEDDVENPVFEGYNSDPEYEGKIDILLPQNNRAKIEMLQKILPSLGVSIGVATAMMPIFNNIVKNSAEFGINIHADKNLYAISTSNTFIVTFFSSFSMMYHFIKQHQEHIEPEQKNILVNISKAGAACSLVLPLGLLWGVELHNQKVSGSSGFDEYIAWATFSTAPLVVNRMVNAFKTVDDIRHNPENIELNSIGSNLVVYGLAVTSVVGRAIAYTKAAETLSLAMGISPEISLGIGIAAGGVLGSTGDTLFEFNAVKSLFAKREEPYNLKEIAGGIASVAEGAWFTLPVVSLGISATESWNPLLRGALFTPLFVSHTILEAGSLYDNASQMYDTIAKGIKELGCCRSYTELEIS